MKVKQLLTCLLVLLGSTTVHAYDFDVNGIYYNIIDADASTVEVTYVETGEGNADFYYGNLTIPNRISKDGVTYTVTAIGEEAFHYCNTLTSVTIGKNVTSIGRQAFMKCTTLTTVSLPDGILHIGYSAFDDCYALDNVTIPATCTDIEGAAFSDCHSLSSITLPEGLTSIGEWFFDNCTSLTEIVIPNSVTSIGNDAFNGCSGLTSVIVGNGVASIGSAAFSNCTSLAKAEFASIEQLCNISFSNGANPLFCAHHLYINGEEVTEVVIPESITSIGDYTFTGCSYLTSVTIPASVSSIGNDAFANCSALTSVTLPAGLNTLGGSAFSDCIHLEYVVLCCSPFAIDASAFANTYCPFYVPTESVDTYKTTAGWSEYADRITAATGWTFDAPVPCGDGTANLTFKVTNSNPWEVEVSASPEDIAGALTIPATIENNGLQFAVKGIGGEAFRERANLTSINISEGVSYISWYAFQFCEKLESVLLPESLKEIAGAAFGDCTSLTSIHLPSQITRIYGWTFAECHKLNTINIPDNVQTIDDHAFYHCNNLTSIMLSEGITSIGESAFRESGLESITFPSTLTTIGASAFESCTNLNTIDFSGCTVSIAEVAFGGCTSLETLDIPSTVTLTGYTVFGGCTSLKTVTIHNANNRWNDYVFGGCTALESVVIPSFDVLGYVAFKGCSNLKSVTILSGYPNTNSSHFASIFENTPDDILFTIPEGTAKNFLLRGYKNLSDKSGLPLVREEFEAEAARIATMAEAATDGDKASLTAAINAARSTVNSTDDYMTVYAQIAAIKTAAKTFMTTATLPENFDVTAATITNPDFDRFDIGWKVPNMGTILGYKNPTEADHYHENGDVVMDYYVEAWRPNNALTDGNISQKITTLPAGVYRLEADVIATNQNDATAEVTGVSLFAGSQKTPVATENNKPQHFSVKFENATTRDVTIGIDVSGTNANWVAMDNVRLIYESKAAAIPESAELKSSETDTLYLYNVDADKYLSAGHAWGAHAILDETGLPIRLTQNEETGLWQIYFWEGAADQKLLWQEDIEHGEEQYKNRDTWVDYHGDRGKVWWNITQAGDGTLLIQVEGAADDEYLGNDPGKQDYREGGYNGYTYTDVNAYVSADKNVHWILFSKAACDMIIAKRKLMDAILRMEASGMTDGATLLSTAKTVYENDDATIKEVIDITTLLNSQMGMPKLNAPVDMTALITNPRFEENTTEGWSGANAVAGRSDATSNHEQEFWNTSFNMYQTITGVPNGRYRLKWKGLTRPGSCENVYAEYKAGTDNASAVVYANDVEKTMKNWASEPGDANTGDWSQDGEYYPNTMEYARRCFDAGLYADELEVEVKDNVLTIGVKNTQLSPEHWVIFSDFELYIMENEEQIYHKLSAEDVKCVPGVPFTYNINLTNRDEVTAFQFEMTLPEGVSIYEENGQQEVQLTNRSNGHMFSCTKKGEGNTYLFSALSLQSKPFKKNSGALVRMTLQPAEDMELGDYEIQVTNVELSKPNGMQVLPFDFTTTLTVKEADPGDVNGDGMITVTDAVYVFRYVNGQEMPHFQKKAADVNGDKQISINDAVGIVNMILGTSNASLLPSAKGAKGGARVLKRLNIQKLAEARYY